MRQAKFTDQESGDAGSESDYVILKCSTLAMAMFSIRASASKSVKSKAWSMVSYCFPQSPSFPGKSKGKKEAERARFKI